MKVHLRHLLLATLVFLLLSGTAWAANYVVANAPNVDANGLYIENGTSDGVPRYTKDTWVLERHGGGMGPDWVILNGAITVYTNHPIPSVDVPPNDGRWWDVLGSVEVPQLTITLGPAIPSLNTWGILIMLTLMAGITTWVMRKNRFSGTGSKSIAI